MSYNDLEDRHVKPRKDKNMCKCLEAVLQHNTHTEVEVQFTEALQIKMQSLPWASSAVWGTERLMSKVALIAFS